MTQDEKIDAAARWLVSREGDGPALIAAALDARWVEISPKGYPLEVFVHTYSCKRTERRYMGACKEIMVGARQFWASERAYEEGMALFGCNPSSDQHDDVMRFITRRTVELWRESCPGC